jgi:hypothetical protein
MSVAKKTKEYKIIKRRDGRFAVENAKGQPVNGAEKVAILLAEGFLKKPEPKPVVEEVVAEEVAAEEPAAEEGAAE